jgi:N-acyl-D-amino-acid deacylase
LVDLVVSGALIADGTGAPLREGSVLVAGERIEGVLPAGVPVPEAGRRVDAGGLVLAPGFVDVHSHSDVTPFVEPAMDSMLRQGVTTLVVGNCGSSAFPVEGAVEIAALAGVDAADLALDWSSFGAYLERVAASRPALNVAALVGHGALRQKVMERDQRREPTDEELGRMRGVLRDALGEGAVGLSSGLIYAPGLHATTDELADLASVLAESGGVYASHVRGEGFTVFDAVSEAIEVGRRAGAPSHISHLKVETRPMWGRSGELLALIDAERGRGADVTADQYPYAAWETSLSSALPPWITPEELSEALADAATSGRLAAAVERGEPGWESVAGGIGWDRIVLGSHLADATLTGRSIEEIARDRGVDPPRAILDLLVADPNTGIVGHAMSEEDVRTILSRTDVFVATDGLAISPEGPLGGFAVHPRYYGTFPRVLGRYVRDEGVLRIEEAVRKMTRLPAERFSLAGRGRIERGAFADLVLFDPARVADPATYERPHAFAVGIVMVLVNGGVAWDGRAAERKGRHGRALRRGEG